jgi:deoxyhypusine synthase
MAERKTGYLGGGRILPPRVRGDMTVSELVDGVFSAYNAARLREGARLFARKMLAPETTVGASLTGALTPGGYGISCLIPLV